MNKQREAKKKYEAGSKTAMTNEKLQHLSDMGFEWSVKKERDDAMWNQRFEELREFKDEHGHCRVTLKLSRMLGKWLDKHRNNKKIIAGRTEVRAVKLEAIGFFDA